MSKQCSISAAVIFVGVIAASNRSQETTTLHGRIVDADTGKPIPARIYIRSEKGKWYFAASQGGSAVEYRKRRPSIPQSVEMHTTLSAHPFTVSLPKGMYQIVIERGHEYRTLKKKIAVTGKPLKETFRLQRWINMAEQRWYSGDTHVHRSLDELPNVMLAEDLNVAFPLVYWVTKAYAPPKSGDRSVKRDPPAKPVYVDKRHVYYPRNTEYEIFSVGPNRHTLGAFFVLNHKTIFQKGVPPVRTIAELAHAEGALLDLDKPNWPWSMMLIPIMKIDLFELSNNHVWRTNFGFAKFGDPAPKYMKVQTDARGFTERGWVDFNFQNYYALLNCGFRLRPTAGTASGVHPVPLGFGRVYVHCEKFGYRQWVKGLDEGRSFVTTGPMLFAKIDDKMPGTIFTQKSANPKTYRVKCDVSSAHPLEKIEVVVNGKVVRQLKPKNQTIGLRGGTYTNKLETSVIVNETSWIIVRCFEKRDDNRFRFAHSAPFHVEVAKKPIRPRRAEVQFLVDRLTAQLKRNKGVLTDAALAEYRRGLEVYQSILKRAKD